MTRRISLLSIAGLMSTFLLLGGLGLPGSVEAQQPTVPPEQQQPTKSGIKAKGKAAAQKTHIKWDSLTPEQQEHLKASWKVDVQKAQAKWDGMTSEQQQQYVAAARKQGEKTRAKWQSLPE